MTTRTLGIISLIVSIAALGYFVSIGLPPLESAVKIAYGPILIALIFSIVLIFAKKNWLKYGTLIVVLVCFVVPLINIIKYQQFRKESSKEHEQLLLEMKPEWRDQHCQLKQKDATITENSETRILDVYTCDDTSTRYYKGDQILEIITPHK